MQPPKGGGHLGTTFTLASPTHKTVGTSSGGVGGAQCRPGHLVTVSFIPSLGTHSAFYTRSHPLCAAVKHKHNNTNTVGRVSRAGAECASPFIQMSEGADVRRSVKGFVVLRVASESTEAMRKRRRRIAIWIE